jgi:hypothetical protein
VVGQGTSNEPERRLPPVTEIAVVTMALVIIAGIYIVAHLPNEVGLALPIALVAAATALLCWNLLSLSRIRGFAWDAFFLVAKWSFLAYAVIAGMLEFVFIHDKTPGSVLTVMSASLVIFAVNIPLLFGFSVARYQEPKS